MEELFTPVAMATMAEWGLYIYLNDSVEVQKVAQVMTQA
jgi:hypothetical protein